MAAWVLYLLSGTRPLPDRSQMKSSLLRTVNIFGQLMGSVLFLWIIVTKHNLRAKFVCVLWTPLVIVVFSLSWQHWFILIQLPSINGHQCNFGTSRILIFKIKLRFPLSCSKLSQIGEKNASTKNKINVIVIVSCIWILQTWCEVVSCKLTCHVIDTFTSKFN